MTQATKPVLTGRTVTLRPLTRLDVPAIHAGLEEPEAKRLTGTHAMHTQAEVEPNTHGPKRQVTAVTTALSPAAP